MQRPSGQRVVVTSIIVVSLIAIFLSILLAGVILFLVTRMLSGDETPLTPSNQPIAQTASLDIKQVDPALALVSLGGVPEEEVISEALEKARPETALASLLYHPFLAHREMAGNFISLGKAFSNRQLNKATMSYQKACLIAIVSPDIPDNIRADILLEASEGLAQIEQVELAKFYFEQAFTLASHSPFLQAVQRRTIYERLHKGYTALGRRAEARTSLDLSAAPPSISPLPSMTALVIEPVAAAGSAESQAAEATRWQMAQQLAVRLVSNPENPAVSDYENLRQALLAEDEQKSITNQVEVAAIPQLSERINHIASQIEWLSIKRRVGKQAYGVSLVPAWEPEVSSIEHALSQQYRHLFAQYRELIIALPDISQINKAAEEILRHEILVGELGLYPNYNQRVQQQQLQEIVETLKTSNPELRVFLGTTVINDQALYSFIVYN